MLAVEVTLVTERDEILSAVVRRVSVPVMNVHRDRLVTGTAAAGAPVAFLIVEVPEEFPGAFTNIGRT